MVGWKGCQFQRRECFVLEKAELCQFLLEAWDGPSLIPAGIAPRDEG